MIDVNSQFFAILTKVGEAKQANADALGIPWKITDMGVGDANNTDPVPDRLQTKLINEWHRRPLNQLKIDPVNPAVIIAEQIIPADEGGKWIREIGLYDADGDLVAVANCAPSFKPILSQGSGRTQIVRMNFIVAGAGNITLKIDPAVVLATREYVDSKVLEELNKLDSKQSVRVATTANIELAGLLTLDTVVLIAGDRVLVKNQTAAEDNGLYVAAAGAWSRTPDADTSAKVTSALLVSVEQGTTQADTRWQLVTDGVIVLGTTALIFQNVTQGFAPINSPALLGTPTTPTPPQFDSSKLLVNSEFVLRALGSKSGRTTYGATTTLTAADIGKLVMLNFSGSATLPAVASLPAGAALELFNWGASPITVNASVGTVMNAGMGGVASFVLLPGTSACLTLENSASWVAKGGDGLLAYSPLFGSSLGATGFKKLPGGYVEQWGWVTMPSVAATNSSSATITLPIAFENETLWTEATISSCGQVGSWAGATCWSNPLSKSQITVSMVAGFAMTVPGLRWRAIGR